MMMLCTRCHKRPATVFVSQTADSKDIKGYCFVCAKELGIKPVNDLMDNMIDTLKRQTGMTEEEFQEATEQRLGKRPLGFSPLAGRPLCPTA